ncbi:MAG: TRAP transporter large permease subunit [Xanthobacteraceae bacterium]|nr:TRAP transporter large permease subunit [Xanthobacteraceae bacterium]
MNAIDTRVVLGASRFATLLNAVETVLQWLGALILAVLLVLVLTSATLRYVFGSGLIWSEELAIWLNVLLVAIGAPLAVTSALAMRLDVVVRFLPASIQRLARLVADGIAIDAGLILALGAADVVAAIGGTSTVLGLPEWLRYACVAGGGALTAFMLFGKTLVEDGLARAATVLVIGLALYVASYHLHIAPLDTPSLAAGIAAAIGIVLGAPLPHSLLAGVALATPFGALLPEPALVQNTVVGVSKFLLLAIPFFLLAGGLLTEGGLADRMVRFAATLVGHLRGGLAQTALVSSVMFSGASGSSIANAAFGAKVMVPALVAHGYALPRAAAIIAATAMLDNIIPPSIAFLILASATNLSVGSLLVGGFVAGGLLALALGIGIYITSRGERPARTRASGGERVRAFVSSLPAIGLGVVVVVGIRFGVVTTTEASALAVAYALIVCVALRSLNGHTLAATFSQAAGEAAAIGLLIGAAAPFAFLLAIDRVSDAVTSVVTLFGGGALGVMLLANIVLLIAGLFLDIGAAILLLGPLLLPAAVLAGIDPIQFGVILTVNLMIHGLTPPLGILVYVASGVSGARPAQVFREVTPLLLALLAALAVMCVGAAILAQPART